MWPTENGDDEKLNHVRITTLILPSRIVLLFSFLTFFQSARQNIKMFYSLLHKHFFRM